MKKILRTALLVLPATACILLLLLGSTIALFLAIIGFIGFFGGLSEADLHLAGVALFGLITVGLCSACCGGGLGYLFNGCLDNLGSGTRAMSIPLIIVSLLSVAATAAIFPAAGGEWFIPVCILADGIHVVAIVIYLRHRKRSALCAEPSSSLPDSP